MKILYLVHQFYPERYTGTEKFILQLAQQMQAAGHTVKVVTYDAQVFPTAPKNGKRSWLRNCQQRLKAITAWVLHTLGLQSAQLRRLFQPTTTYVKTRTYLYAGVSVVAFAHHTPPHAINYRLHDNTLTTLAQQFLTREKPDLIHVGHAMRMAEFVHVARRLQIPYLLTLTDFWLICPRSTLFTENHTICAGPRGGDECRVACPVRIDRQIVRQRSEPARQLLIAAKQIVAPSRFLANRVQAELGALAITYIPYGMDVNQLPANTRHYPTAAPLTFLYAGSIIAHKGIHLLVKAFQQLTTPHIRLEIYGSGALECDLRQQVQADPRIHFGGVYTVAQLGEILHNVDVVVVPSLWYENLPLIMQEAQACGVPTLVSDVGGMTECVTDGVNGFTFRMGDVADLQRKMQMIIDQPERLNRIKENMHHPMPGQYRVTSLAEEANLYLKQYETICYGSKSINL